ncbi:hypothetical protein K458DRAFT_482087 [Lentithecium fluviatile CBS 122367]|uniref:Heterokaryon incompatibility domain-containing protein n=1 Tax=Lentithecium fluviatile CBS 122367 TaxID=1168545 RepID=A0A6G1ICJ5_9PLEO|nr:hypothetical protein K458DRAFT_482087 [Lentithecium fluviatile CBS 122367]
MAPLTPLASTPLYSPLEHRRNIRLLRIKSKGSGKSIEVDIRISRLDSDVQFTALSYVWGDPLQQSWIVCNGHNVPITRNLWKILSTLQEQHHHGLLIQVNMMRDIYKRAGNVIFWLGQDEKYDKDAVRLMNVFVQNHQYHSDLEPLRGKTLEELHLPCYDFGWRDWASLLSRPWFGRVWIVQEFLNATHSVFMSGALRIATDLLVCCAYATGVCAAIGGIVASSSRDIRDNSELLLRPLALAIDQRSTAIAGIEDVRIVDLWTRSQLLGATDPRDRVFALLSTQTVVSMDIIDYKKDVDAVYIEIAKIALATPVPQTDWYRTPSCSLRPNPWGKGPQCTSRFLACRARPLPSSSLPSWVPDWRPADFRFVPLTRYFPGIAYFTGNYDHATIDGKTLYISGIIVDRPRIIIDSMPYMEPDRPHVLPGNSNRNEKSESWFNRMLNWQFICYLVAKCFSPTSKKHGFIEAFCRTMAFNALPNGSAFPAADYIASFQALHKKFVDGTRGSAHCSIAFPPYTPANHHIIYESVFLQLSAGRKFCVTNEGDPAWVPRDTKLGDCICFLAGCAVPFVVRPIDKSFGLIGDCYLHGMMSDESVTFPCGPQLFKFL